MNPTADAPAPKMAPTGALFHSRQVSNDTQVKLYLQRDSWEFCSVLQTLQIPREANDSVFTLELYENLL
jgi:hypothetical protein